MYLPIASPSISLRTPFYWILVAGIVGGLAEVAWVTLYAAFTPADSALVAREVTATVFGAGTAHAAPVGVAVHMLLSIALAAIFSVAIWRAVPGAGKVGIMTAALATLAAIWVINFFVVLPVVNPAFVGLMPLPVTFASKMLFGAAMGYALCRARGT